jgi:hypothetical protein
MCRFICHNGDDDLNYVINVGACLFRTVCMYSSRLSRTAIIVDVCNIGYTICSKDCMRFMMRGCCILNYDVLY